MATCFCSHATYKLQKRLLTQRLSSSSPWLVGQWFDLIVQQQWPEGAKNLVAVAAHTFLYPRWCFAWSNDPRISKYHCRPCFMWWTQRLGTRSSEKTGDTGISSLCFPPKCWAATILLIIVMCNGGLRVSLYHGLHPASYIMEMPWVWVGFTYTKDKRTGEEKDCTPKQKEWNKPEHIL